MSIWPETTPAGTPALTGAQGELVLVSIAADPRRLEELLDALASLPFPVNPEIYHEASVVRVYADGRREPERAVLVDFPAYASHLAEVKEALRRRGFPPEAVWARNLLEEIQSDTESVPAPPGVDYTLVFRKRHVAFPA